MIIGKDCKTVEEFVNIPLGDKECFNIAEEKLIRCSKIADDLSKIIYDTILDEDTKLMKIHKLIKILRGVK